MDSKERKAQRRYLGIGDDCAAINVSSDKLCLITTDMLVDGTHFDLKNVPLETLEGKQLHVVLAMLPLWDAKPPLQ